MKITLFLSSVPESLTAAKHFLYRKPTFSSMSSHSFKIIFLRIWTLKENTTFLKRFLYINIVLIRETEKILINISNYMQYLTFLNNDKCF
jgi:hypothetical protein